MSAKQVPRQPEIEALNEGWGSLKLADQTILNSRIIISDLTILADDDLYGPQVAIGSLLALRARCPQDIKDQVKDKILIPPVKQYR